MHACNVQKSGFSKIRINRNDVVELLLKHIYSTVCTVSHNPQQVIRHPKTEQRTDCDQTDRLEKVNIGLKPIRNMKLYANSTKKYWSTIPNLDIFIIPIPDIFTLRCALKWLLYALTPNEWMNSAYYPALGKFRCLSCIHTVEEEINNVKTFEELKLKYV